MNPQTTAAMAAAATTTVVSLLGFTIQDWLARRSRLKRRETLFEDASRRVSFATEWWKAMELLSPQPDELTEAKATSLAWLNEASMLVPEVRQLPVAERAQLSPSRVLLFYRFERRPAKAIRLCFYLALAFAILYAAIIPSDRGTSYFASDVLMLALCLLLALLLRAWAVTVEKRRPSPVRWPTAPGSDS
ncbi:hypothetical protein [Streptomyces sp. FH025]|uniref:hypothetical protein n=1 Tax=Streptomyces sp. FH025 TaxID=2815937 RepID=UPI001A9E173F|nr:hypothetical protein [Streptomyces sp. FH025]MBO1414246.1 hypothetical protein [Streptomyces sp. FH025]